MITSNHIEYLKSTLEPEEGYPYQELYEWSNEFIQAHYMSSFQNAAEANAWHFVDSMYKKISREHLPICTVEEFMEMEI